MNGETTTEKLYMRCTPKWHSHMHALMDFLNFLPEEVSISILSQLDACDFYHMVQVSRNWNDFIENSEFLWKTLCLKQQNSQNLNMSKKVEHMTWKERFKQHYIASKVKEKWMKGQYSNIENFSDLSSGHICYLSVDDWGDILEKELLR